MDFFHRLATLISVVLFIPTTINTVLQFRDYYKKMKIFKQNRTADHPFKKPIYISLSLSILIFLLFYLCGGTGFVRDYLYPPAHEKIKTIRVHDTVARTVYKIDTVYKYKNAPNKIFENKINKVDKLDEH